MNKFCNLPVTSCVWRIIRGWFRGVVLPALVLMAASPAFAATLTVFNLNDGGPGSLREDIALAASGDTIQFANGLIGTLKLSSSLVITQNVTITGPGAGLLTISGNNAFTVFTINSGTTTFNDLTIANGNAVAPGGGGGITAAAGTNVILVGCGMANNASPNNSGGGIYSMGSLTISYSTFFGNTSNSSGGAIVSGGSLTLQNSTFFGNFAPIGGAVSILGGTATVENSTFTANRSDEGAGIFSSGTVTLANDTIAGNDSGAGVHNNVGATISIANSIISGNASGDCVQCGTQPSNNLIGGTADLGPLQYNGGISQTMMPLPGSPAIGAGTGSTLSSDQRGFARPGGTSDLGAVQTNYLIVTNLNDSGTGSLRAAMTTANGISSDIVFQSGVTGTITLASALPTISSGHVNIVGPGANLLTVAGPGLSPTYFSVFNFSQAGVVGNISGLTIANGNASNIAGGLSNSGQLGMENCAFVNNSAVNFAGAVSNTGTFLIENCTFSGNRSGFGGGIYNSGTLIVENSTFSGNGGGTNGGGLENDPSGVAEVANSTFSLNLAESGGGVYNFGTLYVVNTIVAGNTSISGGSDCNNCTQTIASLIDSPAKLAPLAYNGTGATVQTMIPLPDSTAIGNGSVSDLIPSVTTDERGFPRLTNGKLDIGAVQTNYTGLVFTVQPSDTVVNAVITPAVQVAVQEKNTSTNQTDNVSGVPVTISLAGAGHLTGTLTQTTAPTATFNDLKIDTVITGDSLSAMYNTLLNASSQQFDVTPMVPTVSFTTAPPANVTYGVAPITLAATATYNGNPTGQSMVYYVVSGPGTIPSGSSVLSIYGAGTVVVAARADQNGTYGQASTQATINVAVAALTVTATNATRGYGQNNPVFTGTVTGAQNGDTFNVGGTTTATLTNPVGSYIIVPTVQAGNGTFLSNYNVTYVNAILTVNPATLTVTGNLQRRPYGTPNPAFDVSITGQENNDQFTVTFTTSVTQSSPVGTYAVVPVLSGPQLSNYTVVITNGSLQVIPANLFVVANNSTKVYGTPNPVFSATVTGAVLGDVFTPTFTTTATRFSDVGQYDIQPSVAANANYTVVPTVGILTVTQAVTSLALSASGSQVAPGSPITFTATATTAASGPPAGTVVFSADNNPIGASTLNAQGVATLTVSNLPAGTHVITAAYQGTRDFTASQAQLTGIVIGTPTFTISSNPTSLAIIPGQVGTATLTITPVYGYTGTVNFSCSGLPVQSQCSFNPASVALNGQPVTVNLVIQVGVIGLNSTHPGSGSASVVPSRSPLHSLPLLVPAVLFWLPGAKLEMEDENDTAPRKQAGKKHRALLLIAVLAVCAGLLGLAGCNSLSPIHGGNVPPGPYTVTVTATGNGVTQVLPINVQVE
jgi:hypothetical protein